MSAGRRETAGRWVKYARILFLEDVMNKYHLKSLHFLEIAYLSFIFISSIVFVFVLPFSYYSSFSIFWLVLLITFIIFIFTIAIILFRKKAAHFVHTILTVYLIILTAILTFHSLFWILYAIFISAFPSVVNINGESHKVMATGQIFGAFILSLLSSIILTICYSKTFNLMKRFHDRFCRGHTSPNSGFPSGG